MMFKGAIIAGLGFLLLSGCQPKSKEAKALPVDAVVTMYIAALQEDGLMKTYGRPEAFPDTSLDRILKEFGTTSADFKKALMHLKKDPVSHASLDSLLKKAIETETLRSLNEKETEKNQ